MPGAYTHITLVNEAAERATLQSVAGFPRDAIRICNKWRKYCELGVVSPDYPYLHMNSSKSKAWADLMHYKNTDSVPKLVIRRLREKDGVQFEKGLAWLLGYTAHVVMDVTMHPVVNLRVGPYEQNKREHRVCEMNQDVIAFQRLNLDIAMSEHLDHGIAACANSDGTLDSDIGDLWKDALMEAYPEQVVDGEPRPKAWHRWFQTAVDDFAEEGGWLSAISRHVARDVGMTYPGKDNVDMSYIENLPTPHGTTIHFTDLFDQAKSNVQQIWSHVANGALSLSDDYLTKIGDWSLDTGMDSSGKLVFWDVKQ